MARRDPVVEGGCVFCVPEGERFKEYRETPGNRGITVLRRTEGDRAHFLLISFWDSLEAIRRFAGPNLDRAVYYPKDKEFLLELEPTVSHYEVLASPDEDA